MKGLLTIVLMTLSLSVQAEWIRIVGIDEGEVYFDFNTIKVGTNGLKRAWQMTDFQKPHATNAGLIYWSSSELVEYDCKDERSRVISLVRYSERMAKGKSVESNSIQYPWQYHPPGTVGALFMKAVC